MVKSDNAYKTIGEVAKILNLKSNDKGVLPTHIIRFWETLFKQIKPKRNNSDYRRSFLFYRFNQKYIYSN